ncbi:GNAT family N-acetyltransferase [Hymenobacter cellulosilyticus]|uniref:GNAT family N-acetyltransferase n=1 Tax=Hymenobacter cellulosilyticus TaxID=2932248 RepID=UPI0028801E1D|nr:GNAT family N-acetyltransferase [Hymenobacter cellulosilyticus]
MLFRAAHAFRRTHPSATVPHQYRPRPARRGRCSPVFSSRLVLGPEYSAGYGGAGHCSLPQLWPLCPDGRQAGFARVVTDYATFAWLCDVFVLPEFRGVGLSKWLMSCVWAHPELQGLRRKMLATLDAHGLYTQFGFGSLPTPERFMEIRLPNPYGAPRLTKRAILIPLF